MGLYIVIVLLYISTTPTASIRISNVTNTTWEYLEATITWEIDYEGFPEIQHNSTLICTRVSQYFPIYEDEFAEADVRSFNITSLKTGKPYKSCLFPVTNVTIGLLGEPSCGHITEEIINDQYSVPNHYGACGRYMTKYMLWGRQSKAAVVIASAILLLFIVAMVVSFVSPSKIELNANSSVDEDEENEKSLVSDDDIKDNGDANKKTRFADVDEDFLSEEIHMEGINSEDDFNYEFDNYGFKGV